jgi:DNA repair protein RadD
MLRVIGWTGTAYRGDGVWLTATEDPIFHAVAARVTMRELLDAGYLAPLSVASTRMRMQAEGVAMRAGDYVVSQLAAVVDREHLVEQAADEIVALGADRHRWLVYCVTVAHAEHVCAALTARGVAARVVSADTPSRERDATIADFRAGALRALVNVGVLTTGFDVPEVDLIALLRNTRSPVLYTQIAGRGMRIAPGKADCLWVDLTDTTAVMGPVDAIKGRARRAAGEAREAPHKVCEECGSQNATAVLACTSCGHPFPEPERITHRSVASSAQVLSAPVEQAAPIEYPVTRVAYARHQKADSPDSLRVEYWSGVRRVVSEWVSLERSGFARLRAEAWWSNRASGPAPRLVTDALNAAPYLRTPVAVRVNESGRWPELVGVIWDDESRTGRAARNAEQASA